MTYRGQAAVVALSMLVPVVLSGQDLSITNYRVVSQSVGLFRTNITYTADLVNNGGPLGSVTATLTSGNLNSFTVVQGRNVLKFASAPVKSQVSTSDTVLILVNPAVPFDLKNLQWNFQVTAVPPVANAGPNQAARLGTTVMLDGSGSTNPSGIGTLSYHWAFLSRPVGSTAFLTGANSVRPTFLLDAPGDYIATLTVSNGTGSSSSNVTISTIYTPPVANAGPDQTVTVGSTVVLNGGGSTNVNRQPLSYLWTLISKPLGSTASLNKPTSVSPTFVPDKFGTYVAQLVVNDTRSDSTPATVTITTLNSLPVANAGHNQLVTLTGLAQLNGAGSTDVDGDVLTYKWSLLSVPASSSAVLSDATLVNPTFTVDAQGTYVAQLIVNDGKVDSKPVTVMLTTDAVLPPTAVPGLSQTVPRMTIVTLNGTGNDTNNLPLAFQWALLSKPVGSNAGLSNTSIQNPNLFVDLPGTYVAQLIVSNPYLDSAPQTVTITTMNSTPVANAGQNQNVTVGATVSLNGIGSFDGDNDPLTYSWSLLTRPSGSSATLFGATTINSMFVADVPGTYVAQLIVGDGFTSSVPATVTITAVQTAKLAIAPNPLNMSTATPGTLTLTLAAPAGPGGQVINLTNFNPSLATVPATVNVGEGLTGTNVTVTGKAPGSTVIYANGPGLLGAFGYVNIVSANITVATESTFFGPGRVTNGSITLSSPAGPDGVAVILSANPPGSVEFTPQTVRIDPGNSTGAFTVKGGALGQSTITASAPGYDSGSTFVSIIMVGFIVLRPQVNVGLGQSVPFPVNLATPAPLGGVDIALTSDDPRVTVTPSSVFIPFKATAPAVQPVVNGVGLGTAHVSASAAGFGVSSPTLVQVTAVLSFSPSSLTISGATGTLTLNLSGPAPAPGVTINLSSDNPGVASVPDSVFIPGFGNTVSVPVTRVAPGSTLIRASSPTLAEAAASVIVN